MSSFAIGLSSWILADGNYDAVVFAVGKTVKFALEFWFPKEYSACDKSPSLKAADEVCFYDAVGEFVYKNKEDRVQVLSFGDISAYSNFSDIDSKVGDRVAGNMFLGVDHFAYYETLYKLPGIPPLMYEWQIDRILFDTTPFFESFDEHGRNSWIVDKTRAKYDEVQRTDPMLRHPKNTTGDYILFCSRLQKPPTKDVSGINT